MIEGQQSQPPQRQLPNDLQRQEPIDRTGRQGTQYQFVRRVPLLVIGCRKVSSGQGGQYLQGCLKEESTFARFRS
ncbi:hypothetical protein D3C81_2228450 [compost metagenome]